MEKSVCDNLDVKLASEGDIKEVDSGLVERPPIVVVMGHVDHGKTTLLDAIRQTNVAGKESGGITQSIGAYEVTRADADENADQRRDDIGVNRRSDQRKSARKITFIDTPGHEAFFAMRSHGVKVADVALLVVAADDGVRPQTEEVIKHILEAQIPFIAVINKIDKPGAAVERVKKDLADHGVLVEEWGGKAPLALVSARDKKGLKELLDLILLVAEMEELKYNPATKGEGYVIESNMDPRRGATATVIVTEGVLRRGEVIVCGAAHGPIKVMENDTGKAVDVAAPSQPVKIVGLSDLPMAGEICRVVSDTKEAEDLAAEHKKKHVDFASQLKIEPAGQPRVLSLVIKAAVSGCLEVLAGVLGQIKSDRVGLKIIKCDVGDIVETDIKKAEATGAKVMGFRVKAKKETLNYAEQRGVEVEIFNVIYDFVEGVRRAMSKMLEPEIVRNEIGKIEILAVFRTERSRMIVGGRVISGRLRKGLKFEAQRNGSAAGAGKITGLQREKEAVDEAREGSEAGLQIESDVAVAVGDVLVGYEEEKRYPEL